MYILCYRGKPITAKKFQEIWIQDTDWMWPYEEERYITAKSKKAVYAMIEGDFGFSNELKKDTRFTLEKFEVVR